MIERRKRLKEVYEYVRAHFGVHTQKDFADKIKYSRVYISAAMNGADKYLTDNLFTNICEAFPEVFNLDYLLTGNGQLLAIREEVTNEELERHSNNRQIDQSSLINAALAAKDETIASQKETIASLRETIESLNRENAMLRQQLGIYQAGEMFDHHPFPMGVADKDDNIHARV